MCVAYTLHGGQKVCVNLLLINGFSAIAIRRISFCSSMTGSSPVHKIRCKNKWFTECGVKELDWSAQSVT